MHIHDYQAVQNSWLYLLPFYYKWGYNYNMLVNKGRNLQIERGIKWVKINAENYKSDKKIVVNVIAENF